MGEFIERSTVERAIQTEIDAKSRLKKRVSKLSQFLSKDTNCSREKHWWIQEKKLQNEQWHTFTDINRHQLQSNEANYIDTDAGIRLKPLFVV